MVSADADETENYTYAIVLQIEMRVNGSNGVGSGLAGFGRISRKAAFYAVVFSRAVATC